METVVLKTDDGIIEAGDAERAILAEAGARLFERPCLTEEALLEHGREAAAILTLDEPLSARVIAGLGRCRVISRFGIGVDRVDLEAASAAGIVVTNVPDYCIDEVSDHALALMLAVERRIVRLDRAVRDGVWDTMAVAGPVRRLRGRRLGVIGFGRLGRSFAAKAAALGLEVCAHDPHVPIDAIAAAGVRPVGLDALLASSDVVSLHVPLNPETRRLLDRDRLATMRAGAVLINTSRGGLVDETALADALRDRRLGGAGLDVFEREPPPPDHPLLALPNVVVTSHSSHYSLESAVDMRERAFRNVALVLQGRTPLSPSMRDFAGYGERPPHASWPGGARLALSFVLNYEEGGEQSPLDGDSLTEPIMHEIVGAPGVEGRRVLHVESMYEFGSRAGFWRVHRLFTRRGLPLTVFAVGQALERNPEAARAMAAAGWEVIGHGWRWIDYGDVPADVEREHIRRTNEVIERLCGRRPVGWFTGRAGENTRRLAVEEGNLLYDSDSLADELPYWVEVAGRPHLVVPYSLDCNDFKFLLPNGWVTGDDFYRYLMDTFEQLYEEGTGTPRLMNVGLHCRVIGRPGRARGLARFLDHLAGVPDVWVTTRAEIARHWAATHPPGAVRTAAAPPSG